jgi:uncharacterized protein YxjI
MEKAKNKLVRNIQQNMEKVDETYNIESSDGSIFEIMFNKLEQCNWFFIDYLRVGIG